MKQQTTQLAIIIQGIARLFITAITATMMAIAITTIIMTFTTTAAIIATVGATKVDYSTLKQLFAVAE